MSIRTKTARTENSPARGFDSGDFRCALGNFLTGVTVVTCVDALGRPRGITANSFTSVSLDPPLVLVCVAKSADSFGAFLNASGFGINILAGHQKPMSQLFASKSPEKFHSLDWIAGEAGAPLFRDVNTWFDCVTRQQVDAGDHMVLIGEVLGFSSPGGSPLGYCQGNYVSFDLVHDAIGREGARTVFGCIVNLGERLLLYRPRGDAIWKLPATSLIREGPDSHLALRRLLETAGVDAELNFLFSVFDAPERKETQVFYRGSMGAPPAAGHGGPLEARLFDFHALPWGDFDCPRIRSMLRRFLREQAAESFGIYMDGFGQRRVASLKGVPEDWRRANEGVD